MAIPRYDDMLVDLLSLMEDGAPREKSSLILPLAKRLKVSKEDRTETYETREVSIFVDRMSWALSYLSMAGLLQRPGRGKYAITEEGKSLVNASNDNIKALVRKRVSERKLLEQSDGDLTQPEKALPTLISKQDTSGKTPKDQIYELFSIYKRTKYEEIIDMILSKTPESFERVVVQLLQKMGYGGRLKDAGRTTQLSRDGGIDGEIREDVLGLGRISIQAKRYQRDQSIGRPEIQAFAGALLGNRSTKGVFITTSKFTKDAIEFARSVPNAAIILIDGMQLAEYMYQYGLGVEIRDEFAIKDLDESYWDELADGAPSLPAKA